jgi:pyruvate carboxylase
MEDLVNSINKMKISTELNQLNQIYEIIDTDINSMVLQIINNGIQSIPFTFKIFDKINRITISEIKTIIDYLDKNGYKIIENKLNNTGLQYNKNDAMTYIDYYIEVIDEQISLMEGCE